MQEALPGFAVSLGPDTRLRVAPTQIPACAADALGSCLECGLRPLSVIWPPMVSSNSLPSTSTGTQPVEVGSA